MVGRYRFCPEDGKVFDLCSRLALVSYAKLIIDIVWTRLQYLPRQKRGKYRALQNHSNADQRF